MVSMIAGDANVLVNGTGFDAVLWLSVIVNARGNTKSLCLTTQPVRGLSNVSIL